MKIDKGTLTRRAYELLLLLLPMFGVRWVTPETEVPILLKDLVGLLTALVAGAIIYWNYCRSLSNRIKDLIEERRNVVSDCKWEKRSGVWEDKYGARFCPKCAVERKIRQPMMDMGMQLTCVVCRK